MLVSVWPSSTRSPVSRWIASAASRLLAPRPETALLDVQRSEVAEHEPFLAAISELAADRERALEMGARLVEASLLGVDDRQAVQHLGLGVAVAELAVDRERALVGRARLLHRAGLALHDAELEERDAVALPERAAQRQRLLGMAARLVHASPLPLGIGEPGQHLGFARRVVRRPREREGTLEQRARLLEPTGGDARAPDHGQRRRAQRRARSAAGRRPGCRDRSPDRRGLAS